MALAQEGQGGLQETNPNPNPNPNPTPNPSPSPNPNPNPNQELQKAPLVKRLAGSRWACREGEGDAAAQGASAPLSLTARGDATGLPLGTGRWGALNDPTLAQECPLYSCVFVDFGRGQRQLNGHVDEEKGTLHLVASAYARRRETPWSCTKEA